MRARRRLSCRRNARPAPRRYVARAPFSPPDSHPRGPSPAVDGAGEYRRNRGRRRLSAVHRRYVFHRRHDGRPELGPVLTGGPAPGARTPDARDESPIRSFARTDIPAVFLRHYRAAGRRYGVDWRLLAALGKNESDHGRSLLPGVTSGLNFAGCCSGPMQICQVERCGNVWQAYRRDGDGDGDVSIYDAGRLDPRGGARWSSTCSASSVAARG